MGTRKINRKSNKFRKTRSKKQKGGNETQEEKNNKLLKEVGKGNIKEVEILLEKGADVNTKNDSGVPALGVASLEGHTEIVSMLVEKGADVNAKDNDGWTALIEASSRGYIETVSLLLENGADMNMKDDDEYTALDWAVEFGHTSVVELLEKAIKTEQETRSNKQNAMGLVRDRVPKIPSLRSLSHRQLPTYPTTKMEYDLMLPPSKLGGKRKTRKTRKSNKRGGGISSSLPAQLPETPPECPICTEESIENSITTECGHTFHKSCLQPWCRQHRETTTCPACRGPIGRLCRELLFTELEKILFDAINVGKIDFAEAAFANSINDNGTPKKDNNNILLLDINVQNKDGDTPLILAAKNDQVEIVDMLLTFGADVDELNDDGYSAFHVTDNDDIINLLITFGTEYYDPTDDAVERNIFRFGNRGGKRKTQKKNRKSCLKK